MRRAFRDRPAALCELPADNDLVDNDLYVDDHHGTPHAVQHVHSKWW